MLTYKYWHTFLIIFIQYVDHITDGVGFHLDEARKAYSLCNGFHLTTPYLPLLLIEKPRNIVPKF